MIETSFVLFRYPTTGRSTALMTASLKMYGLAPDE